MTATSAPVANETTAAAPVFNIHRVYMKGCSVELPGSPLNFEQEKVPELRVNIAVSAQQLGTDLFESAVRVEVTAHVDEKVVFLVECDQAGVFEISGLDDLETLIAVACPQIVFPYLRANVADLITRAGFPPVQLNPVNFQQLYADSKVPAASAANATIQ